MQEKRTTVYDDVEKIAAKIKSGETSFIIKVQQYYLHAISTTIGKAVCYYAADLRGKTEEEALMTLLQNYDREGYSLMAIYVGGKVYLMPLSVWGVLGYTSTFNLPKDVVNIARLEEEAKTDTDVFLLPEFLKTLTPSNKEVNLCSGHDICKTARRNLINGTTPQVDLAFTLHTPDLLQGLAKGSTIESLCQEMLERQKEYYREALGLINAIQAKMDSGTVCTPWEVELASALRSCPGKTVTVTFEVNGTTAESKMDKTSIVNRLIENGRFSWYDFPTEKVGKQILRQLNPGNEKVVCGDIAKLTFRGKTIYQN